MVTEIINELARTIHLKLQELYTIHTLPSGVGRRQSEMLVEKALSVFFAEINKTFKYLNFESKVGRSDFYSYEINRTTNNLKKEASKAIDFNNPSSAFFLTDYNELVKDEHLSLNNLQVDRHVYLNGLLFAFIENKSYLDISNYKRALQDAFNLFKAYRQQHPATQDLLKLRFYIFGNSDERHLYNALAIRTDFLNELNSTNTSANNVELKTFFLKTAGDLRFNFYVNHKNYNIDFEKVRQVLLNFLHDFIVIFHYRNKTMLDDTDNDANIFKDFDPLKDIDFERLTKNKEILQNLQNNFFYVLWLQNKALTTSKTARK